jgi:hypothetical protein
MVRRNGKRKPNTRHCRGSRLKNAKRLAKRAAWYAKVNAAGTPGRIVKDTSKWFRGPDALRI